MADEKDFETNFREALNKALHSNPYAKALAGRLFGGRLPDPQAVQDAIDRGYSFLEKSPNTAGLEVLLTRAAGALAQQEDALGIDPLAALREEAAPPVNPDLSEGKKPSYVSTALPVKSYTLHMPGESKAKLRGANERDQTAHLLVKHYGGRAQREAINSAFDALHEAAKDRPGEIVEDVDWNGMKLAGGYLRSPIQNSNLLSLYLSGDCSARIFAPYLQSLKGTRGIEGALSQSIRYPEGFRLLRKYLDERGVQTYTAVWLGGEVRTAYNEALSRAPDSAGEDGSVPIVLMEHGNPHPVRISIVADRKAKNLLVAEESLMELDAWVQGRISERKEEQDGARAHRYGARDERCDGAGWGPGKSD